MWERGTPEETLPHWIFEPAETECQKQPAEAILRCKLATINFSLSSCMEISSYKLGTAWAEDRLDDTIRSCMFPRPIQ